MVDLDHIEALATAATPGPWDAEDVPGTHLWQVWRNSDAEVIQVCDEYMSEADARYIAALSPDVALALVAEVKRLREVLDEIADGTGCETYSYADCCNQHCKHIARAALRGEP